MTDLAGADDAPHPDIAPTTARRRLDSLRAVPHLGTWIGVGLVTVGAALLFVAWVKTAALTNVALQVPYVISAGFTGLALIAVGLVVVNASVRAEDARARSRQAAELVALLSELRRAIDAEETE